MEEENDIAQQAVDCGYHLHVRYGPGLLESVYETMMDHEMKKRGFRVRRQHGLTLFHDGLIMPNAFTVDLLINEKVIIQLKALEKPHPVHARQLMTYLRITGCQLGLLMNFGMATFKEGVERVINSKPGTFDRPPPEWA